jgi:hypothetical protein
VSEAGAESKPISLHLARVVRACLLWVAIIAVPTLVFSQTAARIDNFNAQSGRRGVLILISATLRTTASAPVNGVSLDFQMNDGSSWRSITDDLTVTNNITDPTGRAAVAFLPPDDMAPGTYSMRAVFNGSSTYTATSAETQLIIEQPKCNDEGTVFNCAGAWEAIRIATHRTSGPGIPLILVHGNGQEDERNRANYFGWAALRNSILQSSAYAPFDIFIWKHDTARAIGFNGLTGNAADLAEYVNNRLLTKYPVGTKLLFIAHSRGGLVVRSFMNYQDQGNGVARLVTLGTPHHGSPFAVPDWSALNWGANINSDASLFDRVFSFAFDVSRLGSLNLGWDNLDGAINDTFILSWSSAIAVAGRSVLTPADANSTDGDVDSTVFYSSSLKGAFGTLAELNRRERYADKIVRYGAFDDLLSDNDELMRQSLSSVLAAFALATDAHKALQVITGFLALAHVPLRTGARYYANDGLVPLQSALYLDISNETVFSDVDSRRQVSLIHVSTTRNCGAQGAEPLGTNLYRVWFGSRDEIRDHLDLLETSNACYWRALALDIASSIPSLATLTLQYGFPASAGTSVTTRGDSPSAATGYVRIQPASGSRLGSGFAIYGLRVGGVLVSETAVQASPPLQRGRIYAESGSATRTGLAIANPNDQDVTVSFFFTDRNGIDGNRGSLIVPGRSQIARFLDEGPFNGDTFTGTFTFEATMPVAALALRGYLNERSEFLMTTLPVAQPTSSSIGPVAIPQFADGAGWTTSVFLVNPTDLLISGSAEFFSPGSPTTAGQALNMVVNGQSGRAFSYNIPPRSSAVLETAGGAFDAVQSGWIKITPGSGTSSPVSLAIFRLRSGSVVVSETGVIGTTGGSSFNVYVESSGDLKSGLALTNPSINQVTVSLDLVTLAGVPSGLTSTLVVPAQGQLARFVTELRGFENLPGPFQGILRIRSTSAPLSVIGLRGHINERGDFLMAPTPPLNNDVPASTEEFVIPHFIDGGGYTTQFVLFSGSGSSNSGTLSFLDKNGRPLGLRFGF